MGGADDIEGDDGLGQQLVSEDYLEVGIGATQDCHKVGFSVCGSRVWLRCVNGSMRG